MGTECRSPKIIRHHHFLLFLLTVDRKAISTSNHNQFSYELTAKNLKKNLKTLKAFMRVVRPRKVEP